MRRILFFFGLVSLMFGIKACGGKEECAADKPCPTGKRCVEARCVAADAEKTSDASPSDTTTEAQNDSPPEITMESPKEAEPVDTKPISYVYRWRKVKSPLTSDLRGVAMPSETKAWAVGDQGVILHSADGGQTWAAQTSGVTTSLRSVWFLTETVGHAVGEEGTILRTEDAGKTWVKQATPTKKLLHSIQFPEAGYGYIVGSDFTFLLSADGGKTWRAQSNAIQVELRAVWFLNKSDGILAGTQGQVFYTPDGGLQITSTISGTIKDIHALHFGKAAEGWLVGLEGNVRTSADRGRGWQTKDLKINRPLHGVFFGTAQRGWIVGASGTILGTANGGKDWFSEATESLPDLYAVSAASDKAGVTVGAAGTIVALIKEEGVCQIGEERPCYTGSAASKDKGKCKSGVERCQDGRWLPCQGEILPKDKEICVNGEDDDCNGQVDDGCPACQDGASNECYSGPAGSAGIGACSKGTQRCNAGAWGPCVDEVLPADEICDGKDNDCNGQIDDGIANAPACAKTLGVCAAAKQECKNGRWEACQDAQYGSDYESKETSCDGKDNNCDGLIDTDCPCPAGSPARVCYTGVPKTQGVGPCKEGMQSCVGGMWSACLGEITPFAEVCDDQKDNNCDGKVDEKMSFALGCGEAKYVQVADSGDLKPVRGLTLEGWFWIDAFAGNNTVRTLISKSEQGGYALRVDPQSNQVVFRLFPAGGRNYTEASTSLLALPILGRWSHLAGSFDGKRMRLFVDGKLRAEQAFDRDIAYSRGNVPLIFGAEAGVNGVGNPSFPLLGRIAQVRVSKSAVYTADFLPACDLSTSSETLGLWRFTEGQGDTLKDEVGKHPATRKQASWENATRCCTPAP